MSRVVVGQCIDFLVIFQKSKKVVLVLQKYPETPIHIFMIYATVLSSRDICKVKVVCKDGLEIVLPDQVFLSNRSRDNQLHQNRVSCLIKRKKKQILRCKCGSMINPDISILQCPECLKCSLPSIVKPKLKETKANELWQKLKKTFDQNKGQ